MPLAGPRFEWTYIMTVKKFVKFAARAGSVDFAKRALRQSPTGEVGEIAYLGRPVFYREGTSDPLVIYEILMKGKRSEYWHSELPPQNQTEVILDIGANVGAATVFFDGLYPNARILAIEPIPGNYELLQRNVDARQHRGRISAHLLALSDHDGQLEMIHSPGTGNNGGWSFYQRGASGTEERLTVPVRRSGEFLREQGITRIDIIKVDTEGAEREVLQGLTDEQLATVQFIVGELHGERDFALLDWLEQRGFDIECKKGFGKPCFIFKARRSGPAP